MQVTYTVDIVLCIDATGSMSPVINNVKEGALRFYGDLLKSMEKKGKSIHELRTRVIVYRDFAADGSKAFETSVFFKLPGEQDKFADFVRKIEAEGGGDEPEHGLEAIDVAIRSEWNRSGDRSRQIIVLWTDASAHPLGSGGGFSNYPTGIASSFDELTDRWEGGEYLKDAAKRIILYAPETFPWNQISENWSNAIHYTSRAGAGLSEVDYGAIIEAIANSI